MLKYSVLLFALSLTACTTIDLQETQPVTSAAPTATNTQALPSKPIETVVTPSTTPDSQVAKTPLSFEIFECRVKWKDGTKNKITDVFKVKVDFNKKEVQSGSFKATSSNVDFSGDLVKFTGYKAHLVQISELNRTNGKLDTHFMNSRTHARIDGLGQCSKQIFKQK